MAKKKEEKLPPGVRKRGSRYTYRYSVEVVKDGKRIRKQKETPAYVTAKEAYDAGILIEADKLQGRLVDSKNITLEAWCKRWLEDYKVEREPSKSTLRNRKNALAQFRKHFGDLTLLKDIEADEYQQWLNQMKKKGRKKGTICEYHIAAKLMLETAMRKKIIADNPAETAIVPVFKQTLQEIESGEPELPKFLEKEELKHFLRIVQFRGNPQEHNLFTTLSYTGMRIGELLSLKTSDFDERNRTISITKTLNVLEGGVKKYTLGPPKNKSSIRTISIGETVIKALKNQLAWRDKRIADGEALHDADFIFWSPKYPGYPKHYTYVDERFGELIEVAGLHEALTPHSLRHTFVSLMAAEKVDLTVVQAILGHKNDSVTRLIYLHVTKGQRETAPNIFEKIMEG
jgi:integrase